MLDINMAPVQILILYFEHCRFVFDDADLFATKKIFTKPHLPKLYQARVKPQPALTEVSLYEIPFLKLAKGIIWVKTKQRSNLFYFQKGGGR